MAQRKQPATAQRKQKIEPTTLATATAAPLIDALQRQVANSAILYLNAKHYHWQSFGPHFRDLHLFFDELALAAIGMVDDLAERIRMLGGDPIYAPADLVSTASVSVAVTNATMRTWLLEAQANLQKVIREMRVGAGEADEADDPGTADLFTRLVQINEKNEWFIRQALKERDGLKE